MRIMNRSISRLVLARLCVRFRYAGSRASENTAAAAAAGAPRQPSDSEAKLQAVRDVSVPESESARLSQDQAQGARGCTEHVRAGNWHVAAAPMTHRMVLPRLKQVKLAVTVHSLPLLKHRPLPAPVRKEAPHGGTEVGDIAERAQSA